MTGMSQPDLFGGGSVEGVEYLSVTAPHARETKQETPHTLHTPRFQGLVRIVVGTDHAEIYGPIWARKTIQEMPIREWSPRYRCWLIPPEDAPTMRSVFEQRGYIVRYFEPGKPKPPLVLRRTP